MSSFAEDLAPYIDPWYCLSDHIGTSSGNNLCFWAEALIIARSRGELTDSLKELALKAVHACELEPGFYRRHPVCFQPDPRSIYGSDQEGVDDYLGLAAISRLTNHPEIAGEILAYGQTHTKLGQGFPFHYYYPNEKGWDAPFDLRAWLGRYPTLIAALEWAAGETPSWVTRQVVSLCQRFGSVANDNAARLQILLAAARGDEHWESVVYGRVRAEWRTVGALYRHYFGGDANHPFAKWSVL